MLAPSLNLEPLFLVTVALSDPARSTRQSFAIRTSVEIFAVRSCCLTNTCRVKHLISHTFPITLNIKNFNVYIFFLGIVTV